MLKRNQISQENDVSTHFAPAEQASKDALQQDIERISKNPVIDTVMNIVSGLVAVLNEHRQILSINNTLLEALGIDDVDEVLGLRHGEALNCIHAHEPPDGCGTTKFCATCGAAVAIVASLANDKPAVRECVATVERNGEQVDLHFQVRCCPITYKEQRFLLLFLQDTTIQQQQAALERTFFHDINNTIGALILNSQLLNNPHNENKTSIFANRIKQLTSQLGKEVEIQSVLSSKESHVYQLAPETVSVVELLQELQEIFINHPISISKTLSIQKHIPDVHLVTDASLLRRILMNMLINAFEATDPESEVRFWLEKSNEHLTFCVWNKREIPEEIALRVFQRNFSTKGESGRGLGTYAMKLFGETYLGGKVNFTTSKENGTVFCICLPINMIDRGSQC